jgi:hypothetical protein
MDNARGIKRKRFAYGIQGFIAGAAIDLFVRWILQGRFEFLEAFAAGCAGAALLLAYAEKYRRVPTVDDLYAARLDEQGRPLGVSPARAATKKY